MTRPRKTIDADGTRAKLDGVAAVLRREAKGAEADPFDDAMVAAVLRVVEAMKAEAEALTGIEARFVKAARKA